MKIDEFAAVDRIWVMSLLVAMGFLSVLVLSSQSASSLWTYLLALLVLFNFRQWADVFQLPDLWMVIALLVYLAMSSLWSHSDPNGDLGRYLSRGLLIFCYVVAIAECQLRGLLQRWMMRGFALIGSATALAALVNFALTTPADGRLNGLGQLDTHVIAALVFGVALMFVIQSLFLETSREWRWAAWLAVLILVLVIGLSDSRNAWVSVLIGGIVMILAWCIEDRRKFFGALLSCGLILCLALAALYIDTDTRDLVFPRGDSFRLAIWSRVLEAVWADHMVFGLGIATNDDLLIEGVRFQHAHNMYLSVLYQGGLIALFGFAMIIASTLRSLYSYYGHVDAKLALGILSLALSSYLLDGHELIDKIGETWFLFWLPVALALGLRWRKLVAPAGSVGA